MSEANQLAILHILPAFGYWMVGGVNFEPCYQALKCTDVSIFLVTVDNFSQKDTELAVTITPCHDSELYHCILNHSSCLGEEAHQRFPRAWETSIRQFRTSSVFFDFCCATLERHKARELSSDKPL